MTSPTRDSPQKRAHILTTAGALFAANGYEATSLATISKASGAAIGSISHFFGDKAGLGAAVYAEAADRLVAVVERTFAWNTTEVPGTVKLLVSLCLEWAQDHPADPTLLQMLAPPPAPGSPNGVVGHLEPMLWAWARPLIDVKRVQPLSPAQLYAVMIAPILAGAAASVRPGTTGVQLRIDWDGLLGHMVLAALTPAGRRWKKAISKPVPAALSKGPSGR